MLFCRFNVRNIYVLEFCLNVFGDRAQLSCIGLIDDEFSTRWARKKAIHIVSVDVILVRIRPSNFSIYLIYSFCRYTVLYSFILCFVTRFFQCCPRAVRRWAVASPGFVTRMGKAGNYVMGHSGQTSRPGAAAAWWLLVLLPMQYWSKELWVVDSCTSYSSRLHNTWIVGCQIYSKVN